MFQNSEIFIMRFDDILFESNIKNYKETFKNILRRSYKQANEECNEWESNIKTTPQVPHPIERRLGKHIKALHDFK